MGRFMRGRSILLVLFVMASALGWRARDAAADVPAAVEMAGAPAALTRLFRAPAAKPEWFTPAFLEQVSISQVNTIMASVTQQFGTFQSVEGNGMNYQVHLTRGTVHAQVVVDHAGLIAGLYIKP